MTNQIKVSYCNDPLSCDDFRNTQREILGSVQIPVDDIRIIVPEASTKEQHRGHGNTQWWQVP